MDDDWVQVIAGKEENITESEEDKQQKITTKNDRDDNNEATIDLMRDLLSNSAMSPNLATVGSKLAQKFEADVEDARGGLYPAEGYSTPYYKTVCATGGDSWEGVELPRTAAECQKKLKYLIRRGVPDRYRRAVWLAASGVTEAGRSTQDQYDFALRQTFGDSVGCSSSGGGNGGDGSVGGGMPTVGNVPTFGGSFVYSLQYINESGVEAAKRLLCVIATAHPEIEFSPFIPAIVVVLLGFMFEADAFAVIECVIERTKKEKRYIFLHRAEFMAFAKSFDTFFAKKYSKAARRLQELGVSLESIARCLFDSFFSGYISYPLVLRIFDAFINEGVRVIFRVAVALLSSFKFAALPITSLEEFREYFTQYSLQQGDLLVKHAFSLSVSDEKIQKLGATHLSALLQDEEATQDAGRVYYRPKMETRSEIIGDVELEAIWSFLPRRLVITDPRLIFTTAANGFNLRTMIEATKECFPVFAVIRTRDYAFGFYSSDSLYGAEQDKTVGTGECFLFALRPVLKMFPWTKKNSSFFVLSERNHLLTIGSGGTGAGLVLTDDLNAQSWSCATFDNFPLIGKVGTEKEIPCAVVELYTFE